MPRPPRSARRYIFNSQDTQVAPNDKIVKAVHAVLEREKIKAAIDATWDHKATCEAMNHEANQYAKEQRGSQRPCVHR